MQNQAEDVRRSQDQRDVAYKEYLNAANRYFYAWNSLATAKKPVLVDSAAEYVVEFMSARTAYQSQVNEVFVYGSDDAWSAHQDMARTLPRSVAGSQLPDPATVPDTKAFGAAFSAFLDVRCREVTALSRSSCPQD